MKLERIEQKRAQEKASYCVPLCEIYCGSLPAFKFDELVINLNYKRCECFNKHANRKKSIVCSKDKVGEN